MRQKEVENAIIDYICEIMEVEKKHVQSKSRKLPYAFARHMISYIFRKYFVNLSLVHIGEIVTPKEPRDHATVLHSINMAEDLIATDPTFKQKALDIIGYVISLREQAQQESRKEIYTRLMDFSDLTLPELYEVFRFTRRPEEMPVIE